jgi:hypothetical protein
VYGKLRGSNLGHDTGYSADFRGFPRPFQESSGLASGRIYRSGQDDVPTRTEECLRVRSKNRNKADRDERFAS